MQPNLKLFSLFSATLILSLTCPVLPFNFSLSALPVEAQTIQDQKAKADQLRQDGIHQWERGQIQEALETLQKTLKINREIGDRTGEGQTLSYLGAVYKDLGQPEKAMELLQTALAINKEVGDRTGEGKTLSYIGAVHGKLGEFPKAIELLKAALAINKEVGDRIGEGTTLFYMGEVYTNLGEFKKALDCLQLTLVINKEISNLAAEGTILFTIGSVYRKSTQYQKALEFLQSALVIFRNASNRTAEGMTMNNIGELYIDLNQKEKALEFFELALPITNYKLRLNVLLNLGSIYGMQAKYIQAIEVNQQALEIINALGNRYFSAKALVMLDLSNINQKLGVKSKANEYLEQVLNIARISNNSKLELISLLFLGQNFNSSEKSLNSKSVEYLQQGLLIAQKLSKHNYERIFLMMLITNYFALKDVNKTIEYSQRLRKIDEILGTANGLDKQELKELFWVEINDDFANNSSYLRENMLELQSNIIDLLQFGKFLLEFNLSQSFLTGNINEKTAAKYAGLVSQYRDFILEYSQRDLAIAQELGDLEQEGNALNNLGNAFFLNGNFLAAENSLISAIKIWESIRFNLGDSDTYKISIFETQAHTYRNLQEVRIALNKPKEALEISERGRSRAFVDLLTKRLYPKISDLPAITYPDLQQIKQIAQAQKTTLVEYSIIDEKLFIWVVNPTGDVTFRQVDFSSISNSLKYLVSESRERIGVRNRGQTQKLAFLPGELVKLKNDPPDNEPWEVVSFNPKTDTLELKLSSYDKGIIIIRPVTDVDRKVQSPLTTNSVLQELHKLLIEPIADLLPTDPNAHIIFIPQGELFLVPFPALQDTKGKYLIEKHTILTAPAIQVLDLTRQQRQRLQTSPTLKPQTSLVVGNPTMPKVSLVPGEPPQQLADLPNAKKEAQDIAQLLQTTALTGNQATKAAILQQLPHARFIHLATHGLLDDQRGIGSAIALAPNIPSSPTNPQQEDSGLLTADEILDLKLNAELVVLSACNTGQGKITGDGVIGLSRSLISAGVPSVIVSLWTVPDAPTAALMTQFYQNLQHSPDKAQALRQAMLTTMKNHPEPKDWAAFTLIGEAE